LLTAYAPQYRIAPVTLVIVLLSSGAATAGPFGYAFDVLIAPARADVHLYQAAAESDCALRNAVRRPSQQSISLDPRGNSESILLTSFLVLERI
jgi:hypothetical protein